MKALDTNVLVRFLVRDDAVQAEAVYRRFKRAEAEKEALFVSLLVLLEVIWVLESVYSIARQDLLDAIHVLLQMPVLQFEAQSAVRSFIASARKTSVDLSDILIGQHANHSGCEAVLTFDKQASKHSLFQLLQQSL